MSCSLSTKMRTCSITTTMQVQWGCIDISILSRKHRDINGSLAWVSCSCCNLKDGMHRSLGHRTSGSKSSQFPKRICLTFCPAAVMTGPRPQLLPSLSGSGFLGTKLARAFADVPNIAKQDIRTASNCHGTKSLCRILQVSNFQDSLPGQPGLIGQQ